MKRKEPLFCVHMRDSDGDISEHGIWLCIDDTCIKVADDLNSWQRFVLDINAMTQEIAENLQQ